MRTRPKNHIAEAIGNRALLVPDLVNRGLAAHDRLKYYLALLEAAAAFAQAPTQKPATLKTEREASGVTNAALDEVVAASRMVGETMVRIPGAASVLRMLFDSVRQMLEPVRSAATWRTDLRERASVYAHRLDQLVAQAPPGGDDQLPMAAVAAITRRSHNGHDTIHQLAMDLHWELNRLHTNVSLESIDGAKAHGLTEADRVLVRAFMKGLHETASLRFDQHGLDTTATRDGDRLSIESDLGAADVPVVVVHVTGLVATIMYTDRHRPRFRFFRDLLQPHDVAWDAAPAAASAEYEMRAGRYTAATREQLETFLAWLGSRLVFLIDWNRARKRLLRFVNSADAVALLKWAADNNVGHRAFLKSGDVRLIHTALERAAPAQMRYGARLDDLLGRDAARLFLTSVLRIAAAAASRGSSARLLDDEVEAELLTHLQRSDRTMLAAAADHATVIASAVEWIAHNVERLKQHEGHHETHRNGPVALSVIRSWRSRADDIVRRTVRMLDHSGDLTQFRQLTANAESAVKALEETAFTLTLLPPEIDMAIVPLLEAQIGLVHNGVHEYVQCLEAARSITRLPDRSDLDRFLAAVDRVVALEDPCDAAERAVLDRLIRTSSDFRELHVLWAVASGIDAAFDSLVRSSLMVRDYVLGIAPSS